MTLFFLSLFPLCSLDPGPGVPTVTVHNTTDKRSKCCSFKIFLRLGRVGVKVHETIQPHPTLPQLQGLKMNQALEVQWVRSVTQLRIHGVPENA